MPIEKDFSLHDSMLTITIQAREMYGTLPNRKEKQFMKEFSLIQCQTAYHQHRQAPEQYNLDHSGSNQSQPDE